jgi:hypothetical protein
MRRTVILLIMRAVLVIPVVATGDDQTIPPEAHWTPDTTRAINGGGEPIGQRARGHRDDCPASAYPTAPATCVCAVPQHLGRRPVGDVRISSRTQEAHDRRAASHHDPGHGDRA